ncbi:MAG: HAMP domain-containing protein [Gammaproteobacteria bacterium]|nr:MAG: HAMP domain-containing protein [Gammaproteobacteria bacterium]
MADPSLKIRRRRLDLLATGALVVLLLAALHMMSGAVQRSEALDRWFIPLLAFTVVGLVVLVGAVGWNLWQLLGEYRRQAAGARLNLRLVLLFVILALAPVTVVYIYSLQFLSKGIDGWFDVQVDSAMEDALSLSRVSLDLHKREMLRLSRNLLASLDDVSPAAIKQVVGQLREAAGAFEVDIFNRDGKLLALSHLNPDVLTPSPPTASMLKQVKAGKDFISLVPVKNGQMVVRTMVVDPKGRPLTLQAIYPVPDELSQLTGRVQRAYEAYRERAYLRGSIKFSFALTLSLVMLLGLFAAAWGAFYTSRMLVRPIKQIAEATRAVAAGQYDVRVPMPRVKDELAFLVDSFNQMTRRLAQARNVAEASRRELAAQHKYLETVLGAISSGVIALDEQGLIRTANPATETILRLPVSELEGRYLYQLAGLDSALEPFVTQIREALASGHSEGKVEISLQREGGRQVLLCQYSRLQLSEGEPDGHVLVFDDVTELVQAQRDAAWGEVARRLAHEIKNPLTPIQLAAERLRRKYLPQMSPDQADVLERATKTIVQQVEALKAMVNEFSDYARPGRLEPRPLVIDDFVTEVLDLYAGGDSGVYFKPGAPGLRVDGDPLRLRQVLHNLIKNAQEAGGDRPAEVWVSTVPVHSRGQDWVELRVEDDGSGFDPDTMDQVFEPYVTSKRKGTGLGLAIVKRIVSEHGGRVVAENRPEGGARIRVLLPLGEKPSRPRQAPRPQTGGKEA